MKVIKRDGRIVDFDRSKIQIAIEKADKEVRPRERANKEEIKEIIKYIEELDKKRILVEDIQDIIEKKLMELEYVIILMAAVILFIVGFLHKGISNIVVVSVISFMSATLMITFNKVEGLAYVTNMCTGNLRSASENLFKFLFNKDETGLKKSLMYITILCSFALGAFLGTLFTNMIGIRAIWVASGLLLVVESLMFFEK